MGRQLLHSAQHHAVAQHQAGTVVKTQQQQQRHPLPQRPASPPPMQRPQSPTQFTQGRSNQQQQNLQSKRISVNTHPSTHNSTASSVGLFDQSRVPQWMAPHLPKHCVSPTHFSRNLAPLSPKGNRTMSPRLPSPKMSLGSLTASSTRQSSPAQSSGTSPKYPTLQFGDDTFLWNGWSQWSGKPLWENGRESRPSLSSDKAADRVQTSMPSQAVHKAQPQLERKKNSKRPMSGRM